MINYQLYIENQLMDVDEKLSFPLNKILEELNDPTLIKVEWSKTIQLPMTDTNNTFFGNYFRLDNVTVAGPAGTISGVYFDPTQKLNFKIVYNNEIVMEGYAKMLNNNNSSTKKVYELSLYGKLGEVLNKVKSISLNPTDENYIGDVLTPGLKLNKELVKASFEYDNPVTDLDLAGDLDIIGFAMSNRGLYEDFDSKSFVLHTSEFAARNNKIEPIDKYIDNKNSRTGSSSFFPDGLGELDCRELRSYYQKPYIYVNKVIQLIRDYVNANTDYTFKLSPSWFNDTNPYYSRLIMMLNGLDVKKSDTLINTYGVVNDSTLLLNTAESAYVSTSTLSRTTQLNLSYISEQYPLLENNELKVSGENKVFVVENNINIRSYVAFDDRAALGDTIQIGKQRGIELVFTNIPDNGSIYKVLLVGPDNDKVWLNDMADKYDEVITIQAGRKFPYYFDGMYIEHRAQLTTEGVYSPYTDGSGLISVVGKHLLKSEDTDYKLQMKIGVYGGLEHKLFTDASGRDATWIYYEPTIITDGDPYGNISFTKVKINENKRSERVITLQDLFPDDYKLSDILLNYAKMFNLMWDVDYAKRTITLIDKAAYYLDNTVEDWTDKVDRTQDMIQSPNTFDAKYILLNTDDSDNKYNKAYKEKYEVNYGSYKLSTRYNFNEEKKNLFKGVKPSIVSSEYSMDFRRMLNLDFGVKQSDMILPALFKSDGSKKSEIESIGTFYFRNPNKLADKTILNSPTEPIYITDDWPVMDMNDKYCWGDLENKSSNGLQVNVYPYIDIITDDQRYGCTFSRPAEVYTNPTKLYSEGYISTTKYIYDACWKNWIDERYNVDSKVLNSYFNLNLVDYNSFRFNKFIAVGHNVYSVNSINNFDVNGLKPTKVTSLRITNQNNYMHANDKFDFIECNVTNLVITDNDSEEIKVKSSVGWYVASKPDWLNLLDSYNQVVTSSEETEITLHTKTKLYVGLAKRSGVIFLENYSGESCEINVTQLPSEPYINCLSCVTMDKGNSEDITIKSNRIWSASSDTSWITLKKVNIKTLSDTTLRITCSTNTTGSSRIGKITISVAGLSKEVTVIQPSDGVYVNNDNLFLDSFNLDKTELNFAVGGGGQTVRLSANYAWAVYSKPSWVSIRPYGGTGNKTLSVIAAPTAESRSDVVILLTLGRNRKHITLNINQTV